MTELKTKEGRTLKYNTPPEEGWTKGVLAGTEVNLYLRPQADGGGVFIKRDDGSLHEAATGEDTVWFSNRLWTKTEEAELIERLKQSQ